MATRPNPCAELGRMERGRLSCAQIGQAAGSRVQRKAPRGQCLPCRELIPLWPRTIGRSPGFLLAVRLAYVASPQEEARDLLREPAGRDITRDARLLRARN